MLRMKQIGVFLCTVFLFAFSNKVKAETGFANGLQNLYFIENNGQVRDQYSKPRNDVQYVMQANGMTVFIGDAQMHYQFSRRAPAGCGTFDPTCDLSAINYNAFKNPACTNNSVIETYRMDVELVGANKHPKIIAGEQQEYYENYCLRGCPANGIQAHSYKKVIYKNVYPGIDWVICIKNNKLEHEFIVDRNGDVSNIRLKYNGQTSLKINDDGSLLASTPLGTMKEYAPTCYSADGKIVPSSFRLHDNVLSYDMHHSGALVIDPMLEWGTYYGMDSSVTYFYSIACDNTAHVYACGLTWSDITGTIATSGAFQSVIGGVSDAFLVKFDSSGNRLWGTYYGGSGGDWGSAVTCDHFGNIYMAGTTSSTAGVATPGSALSAYMGGETVGFLAKFNDTGMRQWATYVGGNPGADFDVDILSVSCDLAGHVYISGVTDDTNNIATPGSFKPAKFEGSDSTDCFLIQYDTTGVLKWGTYYGGSGDEYGGVHCLDRNNIYIAGSTNSATNISTPLSYQPAFGGGDYDDFLVKFDSSGNRIWGTYYGGEAGEATGGIACDIGHNIYLLGSTYSDTGIASPGCFQPLRSGGAEAFLVKFNSEIGFRQWGTYFGGPGNENTDDSRIITDDSGYVYICGYTNSTTGIASAGAWQSTFGGGDVDAFFAKYNTAGIKKWSSYYGGNGTDDAFACAFDGKGLYLCGKTNSTDSIATPGSFLSSGGGATFYFQGFLSKFIDSSMSTLFVTTQQTSNTNIDIYPVPNKGAFSLIGAFSSKEGIAQVTITDMAGRIIWKDEAEIHNGRINKQIDLDGATPPGGYFVKVVSQNGVQVLEFVKN
jgi:hypothetical protein